MNTEQQNKPSILMLPWLAHGHISPYFELAKKLSQKSFHIYFCSTPINLESLRQNLEENSSSYSIQLVDLQLPSTFPELLPHNHTTKNLPRHLVSFLIEAFDAAKAAFCNILETLKPSLVIYDPFQPWAAEAAYEHDIAAVSFIATAALSTSFLFHIILNPSQKFPFPEFDFERDTKKVNQMIHLTENGILRKDRFLKAIQMSCKFLLIKSSREIESKFLDYFSSLTQKGIIPVGPLVPKPTSTCKENDTKVMEWLSKKTPSSVVFAAFGSEDYLSKEEIIEIAHGLVLSNVSFIWVVKLHSEEKITIDEALPGGFNGEIEGKGLIIEGWAPQAKILGHPSIGGFVSHCGWGSMVEGIMFGVPIIAIPIMYDHPLNAKLAVNIGVGMEVPREDINERLRREEVARVIKEVVLQEEGNQIRIKAKEMSERMKMTGDAETDVGLEKLLQLVKDRV